MMHPTKNKTALSTVSRIITVILSGVVLTVMIISLISYWKSSLNTFVTEQYDDYEAYNTPAIIRLIFENLLDLLPFALLLIAAAFLYRKKSGTLLLAAVPAVMAINYFFSAYYYDLQVILVYLEERDAYLGEMSAVPAEHILSLILYCSVGIALLIIACNALNGFSPKWFLIAGSASILTYQTYSLIHTFYQFFAYTDEIESLLSAEGYSPLKIILNSMILNPLLIATGLLLLYGLTTDHPKVVNIITAIGDKKRQHSRSKIIEQYKDDMEELKYRLESGKITREEYDESSLRMLVFARARGVDPLAVTEDNEEPNHTPDP